MSSASDHLCVHVIDDEEPIRQTISFMLASAGISTRAYASAAEFIAVMDTAPAGCVLTDVRMPGMSGLDLARHVEQCSDRYCVVVMSGFADMPLVIDAMKCGAVDFLQKPFNRETLVSTITAALARPRKALGVTTQAPQPVASPSPAFAALTPRQHDVLRGILDGKLNKVIAHELGISVRTVESYRVEIMTKTQSKSLSDLVRSAVLAGL
jgi:two-component system response regulator FixJ